MSPQNLVIEPILPGTFLRMFPERHPDGQYEKRRTWKNQSVYYEGHPLFEVRSYVLDRDGGHVTLEGDETFYVMGGGMIRYKKFPYPHPMFEMVGETEADEIRSRMKAAADARRIQRPKRNWRWPFRRQSVAGQFASA